MMTRWKASMYSASPIPVAFHGTLTLPPRNEARRGLREVVPELGTRARKGIQVPIGTQSRHAQLRHSNPPPFPHRHSPLLPPEFGPVAGARARAHGRRIAVRPAGVKPALHVAVDRGVEHGRIVLKDVLRAIAMVDVPVHCACRCFVKGACV